MASQEESKPKIGVGHASAMFRQGLSEIRGALYNDSNVAQPTQYGIFGTKTPGEVAQDRERTVEAQAQTPDQEPGPTLDGYVKQAEAQAAKSAERDQARDRSGAERQGQEREGPELDRE